MARIKYLKREMGKEVNISNFPNFHRTGYVPYWRGVYGKNALMVQCGSYIYNVTSAPHIYEMAK